jgi:hypothetical protein
VTALLERGFGKPTQPLGGDPNHPFTYVIRGPLPVETTQEWLRLNAPEANDADTG